MKAKGQGRVSFPLNVPAKLRPTTLTFETTAEVSGRIRQLYETGLYGNTPADTASQLLTRAVREAYEKL